MKPEEKYRILFENIQEALFIMTHDARLTDINPAGLELFGYSSKEEFFNDVDRDFFVDAETRKLLEIELSGKKQIKDYKTKIKRKDGKTLTVMMTASAAPKKFGATVEYYGYLRDITQCEQERERLKQYMERHDLALQAANMGVWRWDFADTKIFFDEQSFQLFGVSPSSFTGSIEEFYSLAHPDDRETLKTALTNAIEQHDKSHKIEYRTIRPDGGVRHITGIVKAFKDKSGEVVGLNGVHWDVTEQRVIEESLKKSEERLKLTLEAAQIVAWEINVDGSHYEAGPVHKLFGREEGFYHPQLQDLFSSIHPDDREALKELVQKTLKGEREYYIEFRVPLTDGSVRWVEATGKLMQDSQGKPLRILGVARNITERKLAEQMLIESEKRTRSIINAMPIGIHMYCLEEDGRLIFTDANPEADRILGVDHSIYIGKTIEEAFPMLADSEIPWRYREVASTGKIWHAEKTTYESGFIRGYYKVYAFQTAPNKMAAAFEDITEHEKMDEAIRRNEERFRMLVENSNDIITLVNEEGKIVSVIGPVEKTLGYTAEEISGAKITDLAHPDHAEAIVRTFKNLSQRADAGITIEFSVKHKNGRWISVEAVCSNFLNIPNIQAFVATIRDISERRRFQEQLQQAAKMEAIGRLAGGIAHDFNNLLTVIVGNIQMANMMAKAQPPLSNYLDQIAQASEKAASLTRQLLAFSRRQIIEPKTLNINSLVYNIRPMLSRLIGENIELCLSLSEDIGHVRIDPGQFEQALLNMVVNAVDAMPSGGELIIQTSNITIDENLPNVERGKYVMLAVSDTGHGMSKDVLERVFEPFFTTKEPGKGTGLGLATTFGIVKQAGGYVSVYSEPGRGTTFKIYLPIIDEQIEETEKSVDHLARGNSETVMLVEDEESVQEVAVMILEELGYKVIKARDGKEAIDIAIKYNEKIDILITDIVMPGMNGCELAEKLLEIHPETKVLYTSGYTKSVILRHGLTEDNINFLGKPYTIQSLGLKIREVLDSSDA